MTAYRLSRKAAADLDGIHEYTIVSFGLARARSYLIGLHEQFGSLAEQPMLGRSVMRLSPKLRRHEYRSHVVFYVPRGRRRHDSARAASEHGCAETPGAG